MTTIFGYRDLLDAPDVTVGIEQGLLVLSSPKWIHRKVDALIFTGDMRLRRQVSVDFQVAMPRPGDPSLVKDRILVPLAIVKKDLLLGFDLRDESGASMPVLTSDENAWASWSILAAMTHSIIDDDKAPLSEDELDALRDVASASHESAAESLEFIKRHSRLNSLIDNPVFYGGVSTLAYNFLMIAVIDPTDGARRVLKYAYDVDLSDQTQKFSMKSRLGLEPAPLDVDVARLDSRSCHVEVTAPVGLQFSYDPEVNLKGFRAHLASVKASHTSAVAHAHVSRYEYSLPRALSAKVVFSLSPVEHGLLRISGGVGLLVMFLLLGALLWPHNLLEARDNADAAAAPFLALIGVLTLFVVRPGEHQFVSHLLMPYRLLVVLVGAIVPLLMAISLLLSSLSIAMLLWTWFGLFVAAEFCVTIFLFAWLRANRFWRTGGNYESVR